MLWIQTINVRWRRDSHLFPKHPHRASETQPASYSTGCGGFSPQGKVAAAWNWPLSAEFKMSGVISLFPHTPALHANRWLFPHLTVLVDTSLKRSTKQYVSLKCQCPFSLLISTCTFLHAYTLFTYPKIMQFLSPPPKKNTQCSLLFEIFCLLILTS